MYEVWGLFGRYQHSSCFRPVTDRAPVRVKHFHKKTMHEVFGSRKILDRKCVYFLISLIKSISPNDDDEICCSYGTLVTSFLFNDFILNIPQRVSVETMVYFWE